MKQITSAILAVSATLLACNCSSDGEKGGGPSPSGAEPRKFGATCEAATDCDSEVCFEFGNGSKLCSQECTAAADCPDGSQGQKCNMKGYCAP